MWRPGWLLPGVLGGGLVGERGRQRGVGRRLLSLCLVGLLVQVLQLLCMLGLGLLLLGPQRLGRGLGLGCSLGRGLGGGQAGPLLGHSSRGGGCGHGPLRCSLGCCWALRHR